MQIFIVLMKNEEKRINYRLFNPYNYNHHLCVGWGTGLGGRGLGSVFIFQVVMIKLDKYMKLFFDRFTKQNTNFKSVCEFSQEEHNSIELHCSLEFLFPYHVVR